MEQAAPPDDNEKSDFVTSKNSTDQNLNMTCENDAEHDSTARAEDNNVVDEKNDRELECVEKNNSNQVKNDELVLGESSSSANEESDETNNAKLSCDEKSSSESGQLLNSDSSNNVSRDSDIPSEVNMYDDDDLPPDIVCKVQVDILEGIR